MAKKAFVELIVNEVIHALRTDYSVTIHGSVRTLCYVLLPQLPQLIGFLRQRIELMLAEGINAAINQAINRYSCINAVKSVFPTTKFSDTLSKHLLIATLC